MIIKRDFLDLILCKVFLVLVFFLPLADFISVYSRYSDISVGERFSLAYRMFFIFVGVYFFIKNNDRYKSLIGILFYLSFVSISATFFVIDGEEVARLFETLVLSFKFFVFFILVSAFSYLLNKNMVTFSRLKGIFSVLIAIYAGAIVIGALFDIEMLKNYNTGDSERWGVKGIIIAGNEASGFLTVALAWVVLHRKNFLDYINLAVVVLASIVSGTKAALLAFLLIMASYLLARYKLVSFIYIAVFFLFTSLFAIFTYSNSIAVQEVVDQSLHYFMWHFDNSSRGDVVNLLLTGRDYKLGIVYEEIYNSAPWVYIFGGFPIGTFTVEMDFFDVFALFGFFGSFLYFYLWFKSWSPFNSDVGGRFKLYFCISFFVLGFLGGHYYYSAMASPFLAILCLSFKNSNSINGSIK